MSNQYIYSEDQRIIIQDGAIIWNDQSQEESSLQYFDANDAEINNCTINETYVTAIDSNETQYLSILEQSDTNDITLEDLQHLTIEHGDDSSIVHSNSESAKMGLESVEENSDENDSAQVIVFTMEGSDDLYGIQLTLDESGSIQKYQFKFRTTSDGQLEPDPETVTLLPNIDQRIQQTAYSKLQDGNIQSEEIEQSETQEYLLMSAPLNTETSSEENVENDGVERFNIEHVYIKGEDPESLEGETEDVDSEVLQGEITVVPPDTQLESHLENLCIKTEIMERAGQNLLSPLTKSLKLKQELGNVSESEFESEDMFDSTLQNESTCDEEFVKIQPQDEYETEIQVYEQSDVATDEHMNSVEEIQRDQFISSEENEPTHEQLVQHFISENGHIEVQYETELEVPYGSNEEHEYDEEYKEQGNHSDYSGDYLMDQNAEHVHPVSEADQYEIENNYSDGAAEVQESTVITSTTELKENHHDPCKGSNILTRPLDSSENDKSRKPLVSVKYYVVYPEKENVNSLAGNNAALTQLPIPKVPRSNPRSVLRTSFLRQKDARSAFDTNELPECDLYHKRFAKNKDAMRAKNFHNFLNRTTIPHAPIRRHRQPRKQEIKPVIERSDEEIIVQEVIVSSTGFVESLNRKVRNKNMQVTAVVELSDSEDESGQVKKNRRKSHHVHRKSESEVSVIEVSSDTEKTDIPQKSDASVGTNTGNSLNSNKSHSSLVTLKRRRGRPPKNKRDHSQIPVTDIDLLSSKRNCVEHKTVLIHCDNSEPVSSTTDTVKKEITCPFCPKSFPSQNSLNTHIIHHNLENSLKSKAKMNSKSSTLPRQSLLPKLEYNHKCDECQETFKNVILLKKHNCTKKQTSLSCSVCLKQFRDITMLNIHKKSHAKSNLVRNTSITKVSPKKVFSRPSVALNKSCTSKLQKRTPVKSFKCAECPKVCDSEDKLSTHTKMHTRFVCSSCFSTFSSKLLLDTHIRTNCVKVKANNKRLSFTIRKSFIHTPPRRLSICKPANVTLDNTMNQSVLAVKLDCDKCSMKFSTFRKLYIHKVQKHGLNTPDKTLMTKPKQGIYKPKAAHGGIPANDRLKKAFAALRKKIAETEDLIVQ